jgi:tripartite-type tricarboxylate transporter receptor subunit TctC
MNMQKSTKRILWVVALSFGTVLRIQGVLAQEYPTKSINLFVCMQPGAGVDLGGRMIAQEASKTLGQEIVPVNKAGGGGAVAAGILAVSKPDGYNLMSCTNGPLTTTPHLESVSYDALKDFTPLIQFGSLTSGILVRSDSPFRSLKEFLDFARRNPGKLSYGFPGIGTVPQLAIEHVMLEEKVNIATIPFEGSAPTVTALLGGHTSACGCSTSGFLQHLKAGKVRVLATTGEKRIEVAPEAPTLLELGYPYGVLMDFYFIAGPKGVSPAVTKTLEGAFLKAMETQGFQALAERLYMQVKVPLHGQKFKEYVEEIYKKNGEIIRKAKLGTKN